MKLKNQFKKIKKALLLYVQFAIMKLIKIILEN